MSSSSIDDYTEKEIEEMRELILSISLEPTDDDRRARLVNTFQEFLSLPNGSPKKFTDLFDKVLIQIGGEKQEEAKQKYLEQQEQENNAGGEDSVAEEVSTDDDDNDADAESSTEPPKGLVFKSPEEFQVWALVDMMVQSKTIVKKASGELGSKGSFQ